jgi:hypothetical protein
VNFSSLIDGNGGFLQNLLVVVLPIIVTGLLIPVVLRHIDEQKSANQERLRAALARQQKVIDAQVDLLDSLGELLWRYQSRAITVMYFQRPGTANPELFTRAARDYEDASVELLGKIRSEISKLLRLAPTELYDDLIALFYDDLLELDECLVCLIRLHSEQEQSTAPGQSAVRCARPGSPFANFSWADLEDYTLNSLGKKVDYTLNALADALSLKWQGTHDFHGDPVPGRILPVIPRWRPRTRPGRSSTPAPATGAGASRD